MAEFAAISRVAQLARLRRLGLTALEAWGLSVRRVTLLRYWENATWRVDAVEGTWLLRVHRPGYRSRAQIEAELDWLEALHDGGLCVQRPRATPGGQRVVCAGDPGVPQARLCTLLSWQEGRSFKRGARPAHFRRLGSLLARLHHHAERWRPEGWERPRYDASDLFRRPIRSGVDAVDDLLTPARWDAWERAAADLHAVMAGLGRGPAAYGPIHSDLHFDNLLFAGGEALAIDFDDCGWGHYACDFSAPLQVLDRVRRPEACREALLEGYAGLRALPPVEAIDAFVTLGVLLVPRWYAARLELAEIRRRAPRVMAWCDARVKAWHRR